MSTTFERAQTMTYMETVKEAAKNRNRYMYVWRNEKGTLQSSTNYGFVPSGPYWQVGPTGIVINVEGME